MNKYLEYAAAKITAFRPPAFQYAPAEIAATAYAVFDGEPEIHTKIREQMAKDLTSATRNAVVAGALATGLWNVNMSFLIAAGGAMYSPARKTWTAYNRAAQGVTKLQEHGGMVIRLSHAMEPDAIPPGAE